jgi:hypothetical protein
MSEINENNSISEELDFEIEKELEEQSRQERSDQPPRKLHKGGGDKDGPLVIPRTRGTPIT